MKIAPLPDNEQERIAELRKYNILDTEPDAALSSMVQLASYICKTPIAAISLVDEHRQWFKAITGLDAKETSRDVAFCAHAILQKDVMIVTDARKDDRFADNPLVTSSPDIRFYAGVPLVSSQGHSLGTLCVIDRVPRVLEQAQLDAIKVLADNVMAHLDLRLSHENIRQYLDDLQIAATIFDSSSEAMVVSDAENRIVSVNPAFTLLTGYTINEVVGKNPNILKSGQQSKEFYQGLWKTLEATGHWHGEIWNRRKNGEVYAESLSLNVIYNENGSKRLHVGIFSDITEKKKNDLAIQQSAENLRLFIENAPVNLAMFDQEMRYLAVSKRWKEEYKLVEKDVKGLSHYELFPNIKDEWKEVHRRCLAGESVNADEDKVVRANGKVTWFRWAVQPWRQSNGMIGGIIIFSEDITERKSIAEKLVSAMIEVEDLYENAPCGYHSVDKDGNILRMNSTELAWHGFKKEEVIGKMTVADIFTPASVEKFKNYFPRLMIDGHVEDPDCELICKDGMKKNALLSATAVYNSDGSFLTSRAVLYDVTERRMIEKSFRETNEKFHTLYQFSPLGVVMTDMDGRYVEFNEAFRRISGYAENELKLLGNNQLTPEKYFLDVMSDLSSLSQFGKYGPVERQLTRKDGELVPVRISGVLVTGADNKRGVWSIVEDITDLKNAEAEVLRMARRNELLLNSAGEGIYGADKEGNCTFINPAALDILGFTEAEILGRDQHSIFHHHRKDGTPYPRNECPIHLTLQDGLRRDVEDEFIRKNGESFPVQLTVTAMREDGQVVGVDVVFQDILLRKEMEMELKRLATTDPLTGVPNRRHFLERFEIELAQVQRFDNPVAFLMVDIDNFKMINDSFGHAAGDEVLKNFTEVAGNRLRRIDMIGRLGGEEFGILLPGTDIAGAFQFAESFRIYVSDTPAMSSKGKVPFTISIGIAAFDPEDESTDCIMARADQALYRAKGAGRNRSEVYK